MASDNSSSKGTTLSTAPVDTAVREQEQDNAVVCGCLPSCRGHKRQQRSREASAKSSSIRHPDSRSTTPSADRLRMQSTQHGRKLHRITMYHETPDGNREAVPGWISDSSHQDDDRELADLLYRDADGPRQHVSRSHPSDKPEGDGTVVLDTRQSATNDGGPDEPQSLDSDRVGSDHDKDVSETDIDPYPIITTTSIKRKPRVSMLEPYTMLSRKDRSSQTSGTHDIADGGVRSSTETERTSRNDRRNKSVGVAAPLVSISSSSSLRSSALAANSPQHRQTHKQSVSRSLSNLFQRMMRQSISSRRLARSATEGLRQPRIVVEEKGFPGQLTPHEFAQAQRLSRELKKPHNRTLANMVYVFNDIEEQPFALCRFLRPTKFNVAETVRRLNKSKSNWERARDNDFFPNLSNALGCPKLLFLSQAPVCYHGYAKNGCPVSYLQAGRIEPEGLLSITTLERTTNFFWHQSFHAMGNAIKASQAVNPDVCRIEAITVIDLKGVSASTVSSPDAKQCVKLAGSVADSFPETLHCMIVMNAPSFFAMTWSVIRRTIDPRTAQRIQVFKSTKKALRRLHELIDVDQLPRDYDGTNAPLSDVLAGEGDDDNEDRIDGERVTRRDVKLVSIRKRGTVTHAVRWDTKKERVHSVRVHTRSASSAEFGVVGGGTVRARGLEDTVNRRFVCNGGVELPLPRTVGKELRIKGTDQHDADEKVGGKEVSTGYFLIETVLVAA